MASSWLSRGHSMVPGRDHTWRITTAVRIFILALSAGLGLSNHVLGVSGATLLALCVLAAIMSAVEFDAKAAIAAVPVAEALLASVLVATAGGDSSHLTLYLAVPPLVAGLRHGMVNTVNTVFAEILALLVVVSSIADVTNALDLARTYLTWVAVGLGAGTLAVWLRRSNRAAEADQAPYLAAHSLLDQLRDVTRRLPTGLDTPSIAEQLTTQASHYLRSKRVALLMHTDKSALVPLTAASAGSRTESLVSDPAIAAALDSKQPEQRLVFDEEGAGPQQRVALPIRVDDRVLGVLVAELSHVRTLKSLRELQRQIDGHSLRLETAMLFDEVRSMATIEERNRLAREIHDGVAQEVASLGYLVDDLAASADTPTCRQLAAALRGEITRVVGELRLSIFDLRHDVEHASGLGNALAEYVAQIDARTGIRVHLQIQERDSGLQRSTESELLRIAQEAINNARKHSSADNLWVQLELQGSAARVRIEDDGSGSAATRDHHYGLRTMHERADRIGATLTIEERIGGGTVVDARLHSQLNNDEGATDAHHYSAR